jgi:hypothetical protein
MESKLIEPAANHTETSSAEQKPNLDRYHMLPFLNQPYSKLDDSGLLLIVVSTNLGQGSGVRAMCSEAQCTKD